MRNRLIQATATALLFVSLSAPAYAHGKGNEGRDDNDRGRGFGASISKLIKTKQADWKEARVKKNTLSDCLKAAQESHDAALKAARKTRDAARDAASSAFHTALESARKTRDAARKTAREAFLSSDKGEAAKAVYESVKSQANSDRWTAYEAAGQAWFAARIAAQKSWETAKAKADADFQTAKTQCAVLTPPSADVTAPAAVIDPSLSGATVNSLVLGWTAPGDDGAAGTAAAYDIRYSTSAIASDADFAAAVQVIGEPAPALAGTAQTMTVTGLSAATTYYFVMKAQDEVPNVSAKSNVPSLATLVQPDVTAPAAVIDLSLSGATVNSLVLGWTAPGDDGAAGTAAAYDIRYSTSAIASDADFAAAVQVIGEPAPALAGTAQTMTVTGLSAATTYYFVMKAQDEVPNVSIPSNGASLSTL